MIYLDLIRVGQSGRGTFGVLRNGEVPFALTLEPPWRNNLSNLSCIPAGKYLCRRVRSTRFGWTFQVQDVPERTHVLFHRGNAPEDTEGCILVGEEFSGTWDKPRIASSERGFMEFMNLLNDEQEFTLRIVEVLAFSPGVAKAPQHV